MSRVCRPGETCVYQWIWRNAVWAAQPFTVVEDDGEVIVSHIVPGTLVKAQPPKPGMSVYGSDEDSGERQWARMFAMLTEPATDLVDREWTTHRRLVIAKTGARHIVSLFWRGSDDVFLGWYVDFVEPVRRTPIGIATMDLMLDIEIEPDRSSWSWKDDDHFEAALGSGLHSAEVGREVRAEASAVIATIERGAWPFNTTWPEWRPDSHDLPMLPSNWATVFE